MGALLSLTLRLWRAAVRGDILGAPSPRGAGGRMPQGFKYSCFVSYCHGQHDLVKSFIEQLRSALESELEALLDEPLYIDDKRLEPGFLYNEALADAICRSVCMIVVYSPRYERHDYCVREYEAMAQLEDRRRKLLGPGERGRGFIIPIVFRGGDDLPDRIKGHVHYVDFSKFTLATPRLAANPEYVEQIKKIAQVIYRSYTALRQIGSDPCKLCDTFFLPTAKDVTPWRPRFVNR
jgi:hypothetical protein